MDLNPQASSGEITLKRARTLLEEGALEESLAMVKAYWLEHPDDSEAAELFANLMQEAGRSDLSVRLENLAKTLPLQSTSQESAQTKPKALFEAGFGLIDIRQHELAAMLLDRCFALVPDEPVISYELGFALMSLRRFKKAIPYFENAAAKAPDFDTFLNLTACYTMTGRKKEAEAVLKKIENLELDHEQSQEAAHRQLILRRLDSLGTKSDLNVRDWVYVLYGTILLRQSTRQDSVKEDAASIGEMLALFKGLMEGLRVEFEVVEFYGPQSRPLARALAELLEIPFDGYKGPSRSERALLTMTWASDIIGPHKSFTQNSEKRALFSYGLTWDEPLPLVPDLVGCLAHDEPMPWRHSSSAPLTSISTSVFDQEEFDNKVEAIYKSILNQARDLESEPRIIQSVLDAVDYYSDKASLLTFGNSSAFPNRSEYTAELD